MPTRILNTVSAPTLAAANTGNVSLTQLKQRLIVLLEEVAPDADPATVEELIAGVLREAGSSGKTTFTQEEIRSFLALAVGKIQGASTGSTPVVAVNGDTENFKVQLACINSGLPECGLLKEFAARVLERTGGRLEFVLTSYPELGLDAALVPDELAKGNLDMAEVSGRYISADLPAVELTGLPGLYPDSQTSLKVLNTVRVELRRIVAERTGGVILLENYYTENMFFSVKPLTKPEDFRSLRVRVTGTAWADLMRAMGAEPFTSNFSDVPTAFERGIMDAAINCGTCGGSQSWYQVTDYLIGPVPSIAFTWLSMNRVVWNRLPADIKDVVLEEATRYQQISLRLATNDRLKQGIQHNVNNGMKHLGLSPEIQAAFRKAAIDTVLPAWVKRVGGPSTPVVRFFNEYVAPIVGVIVNTDGTASKFRPITR